jgi:hypothetical protein
MGNCLQCTLTWQNIFWDYINGKLFAVYTDLSKYFLGIHKWEIVCSVDRPREECGGLLQVRQGGHQPVQQAHHVGRVGFHSLKLREKHCIELGLKTIMGGGGALNLN